MPKDVNADAAEELGGLDQDASPESQVELDEGQDLPLEDAEPEHEDEPHVSKTVPTTRLNEVIAQRNQAEEKAAEAERARIVAERQLAVANEDKRPKITRDLLRNAVEQGTISQQQAEDAWDTELVCRATAKAKEETRNEVDVASKIARVDNELGRYRKVLPAIADKHSPERKVLEDTYAEIVDRFGPPKDKAAELSYEVSALREVFGRVENLEKTHSTKRPVRQSFREIGSAKPQEQGKDPLGALNNVQKRYYAKMIDRRVYKNWDEVKAELTWKRGQKST